MTDKYWNKCWKCKERDARKMEMIEFIHQGLRVCTFKDGGSCRRCIEESFKKCFNKYADFLTHKDGKIVTIKWENFCQKCEQSGEVYNYENEIVELFLQLGIFSLNPKDNWLIISDSGVPMNPIFSNGIVYFTNFVDAVYYAKEKFLQTQYVWHLRKITESYSKNQLLELGHLDRLCLISR